jgi:hypothetical protein
VALANVARILKAEEMTMKTLQMTHLKKVVLALEEEAAHAALLPVTVVVVVVA